MNSQPTRTDAGAAIAERFRSIGNDMATAVLELLQAAAQEAARDAEPFIGKKEAAKYLNISVSTLERKMAGKYGPPRYVDGGKVSFRRSELSAWREQWRVAPASQ